MLDLPQDRLARIETLAAAGFLGERIEALFDVERKTKGKHGNTSLGAFAIRVLPKRLCKKAKLADAIAKQFGDGIMSAIDFDMVMERLPNPKGDRVKFTMSGKFLPNKYYGATGNHQKYGFREG